MRGTICLRGRRLAVLAAVAAALLVWGVAAPPAGAKRAPGPRPSPSVSATPSASASPTAGPTCGFAVVASPNASDLDNTLFDVAVLSPTDAWAVGEYTVDGYAAERTLIQHYDGTAWTIVPSPNRLTGTGRNQINSLRGVTAIAANVSLDDPYRTLTMHWNGAGWSIVDSPNYTFPGAYNALLDIAAVASNDVWAVGGAPFAGVGGRGLLLHFDGTAWTVPVAGAQFANDVDAAGPGAVWAVGSFGGVPSEGDPYGPYPIGYHFTGAGWQEQSAAALGLGAFTGVAVRANTEVIAVGFSGRFTYALRFTGHEWQRLAAGNGNPSPSTTLAIANVLLGIAHAGTSVWAVGYYFTGTGTDSGVQRTLIERYTC